MPKQLILLAGLHKTATTSIQHSCAANQAALRRSGYPYPTLADAGASNETNHTRVFNWFREDPARAGLLGQFKWTSADLGNRAPALANFSRALEEMPDHLLMAAEGVSLFTIAELTDLKNWLSVRGWDVRVMCHVRHLASWMNSMIAQRVTSALRLSIGQAVDEYVQYNSIVRRRIEAIKAVFPQAEFYSHEEAVRHPSGPVGFFLQNAGIALPGPVRLLRANEGNSDCATRVFSLINEKFGRFDDGGNLNPAFFGNPAFADALKRIGGRKFLLRPAEVAPILPLLQADNEWLKTHLGQRFHDSALEFQDLSPDWLPESLAQLDDVLRIVPAAVRDWVLANRERLDLPR